MLPFPLIKHSTGTGVNILVLHFKINHETYKTKNILFYLFWIFLITPLFVEEDLDTNIYL